LGGKKWGMEIEGLRAPSLPCFYKGLMRLGLRGGGRQKD